MAIYLHKARKPMMMRKRIPIQMFNAETADVQADQALKREITLEYDKNGHVLSSPSIDLGIQYENRVTWLRFNFDQLLWNTESKTDDDYTNLNKYDKYLFRIYFKQNEHTFIYEINPQSYFEVPRTITQYAGNYEIAISIQEILDDTWEGNVKEPEIFITDKIVGTIASTWFNPAWSFIIDNIQTNQIKSLIKEPIDGNLTDQGIFTLTNTNLGRARDQYMKYIRFNIDNITAHLDNLDTLIVFYNSNTKKYYYESLVKRDLLNQYEDQTAEYPYVAWVPEQLYEEASTWEMIIVSFAGDVSTQRDDDTYYFYISNAITGTIDNSLITTQDLDQAAINQAQTNFNLNNGDLLYTADNQLVTMTEEK